MLGGPSPAWGLLEPCGGLVYVIRGRVESLPDVHQDLTAMIMDAILDMKVLLSDYALTGTIK